MAKTFFIFIYKALCNPETLPISDVSPYSTLFHRHSYLAMTPPCLVECSTHSGALGHCSSSSLTLEHSLPNVDRDWSVLPYFLQADPTLPKLKTVKASTFLPSSHPWALPSHLSLSQIVYLCLHTVCLLGKGRIYKNTNTQDSLPHRTGM